MTSLRQEKATAWLYLLREGAQRGLHFADGREAQVMLPYLAIAVG